VLVAERVAGVLFVGWLQLVGVLHHILHALPVVVLLVLRPSAGRAVTGLLAGCLCVFLLAAVTPMIHDALILGYVFTRPRVAYT
jgi:hypothetical protein